MKTTKLRFCYIVLIALLLRGVVFLVIAQEPMLFYQPDSKSYEQLALNLIAGHGFSQGQEESFAPDIYRTPVYPLFIALIYAIFGQAPQAVSALQALIASLATGLCYLMGRQMLSEREARLGSILLAISPISILYSVPLLTETLFSLLFLGSVWSIVLYQRLGQRRWLVSGGGLAGLVILCRPIALFFPLIVAVMLGVIHHRHWLRDLLLFLTTAILVVAPWVARNYSLTEVPTVAAISNLNLLYYNATTLEAHLRKADYFEVREEMRERVEAELEQRGDTSVKAEVALYSEWGRQIILAHPWQYLCTHLVSDLKALLPDFPFFGLLFGVKEDANFKALNTLGIHVTMYDLVPLLYIYVAFLWLLYSGAVIGIITLARQRDRLTLGMLLLPVAYLLLIPGSPATPRFRVPAMPYICLISSIGLVALRQELSRFRRRKGIVSNE